MELQSVKVRDIEQQVLKQLYLIEYKRAFPHGIAKVTYFQKKTRFTPRTPKSLNSLEETLVLRMRSPLWAAPTANFMTSSLCLLLPQAQNEEACKTLAKHNHLPREKAAWGPSVHYRALLVLPLYSCQPLPRAVPFPPSTWSLGWLVIILLQKTFLF